MDVSSNSKADEEMPANSRQVLALSHVILHLGFCSAIARVAPTTTVALHVRMADRIGRVQVDRVYRVERGDEAEAVVEFDSAFGIYSLAVDAPKYRCSASDYLFFIAGHDRSVTEKLSDAPTPPSRPVLLSGTAPQSFLYVAPTFVLFDKSQVACNKTLPQPLSANIVVENDQDGYYAWLYPDASAGRRVAAARVAPANADPSVPLRADPDSVSTSVDRLAAEHSIQRDRRDGRRFGRRSGRYAALPKTLANVRRLINKRARLIKRKGASCDAPFPF